MSEKINSLNLCVCMALADHGLGKDETAEILKIAKEIKVDFNVHNATDEIDKKFSGDIEKMESLGIYEVIPEDFGLVDFSCTSKIEAQEIVKNGIEIMLKEVG